MNVTEIISLFCFIGLLIVCIEMGFKTWKKLKANRIVWKTISRRTNEIERITGKKVILFAIEDIKDAILNNIRYGKEIINHFIDLMENTPDSNSLNVNVAINNWDLIEEELYNYLKELKGEKVN